MRIFLIGCLVLFVLIIIVAAMKSKGPINRQATRKRSRERLALSRREKKSFEPARSDEPSPHEYEDIDADVALGLKQASSPLVAQSDQVPPAEPAPTLKYIAFHVMAPRGSNYTGYNLLHALLAQGFRYGSDKIFHRYEQKIGVGEKFFSLASANQPGTFDLPNMANFSCPGLTLFLVLKNCKHPQQAFELMVETAKNLAEQLGGEVWNEQRELLDQQQLYDLRLQIEGYLEQNRTSDLLLDA